MKKISLVTKGLLTYIPGLLSLRPAGGTGGTDSAVYCYGVWMKHLALLAHHGAAVPPRAVVELGPGDSLGIGLCALLSGADKLYALDVSPFAAAEQNVQIFDALVQLFHNRAPRPMQGWPDFDPLLGSDLYPSAILTEEVLRHSLARDRLQRLRRALVEPQAPVSDICIRYIVPWPHHKDFATGSIDLVISHAVLEYVSDLQELYASCRQWLRPGGMMSHQIDFGAHALATCWNGHLSYPEWLWRLIVGRREVTISRMLCADHLRAIRAAGFEIVCELHHHRSDGLQREQLARRWRQDNEADLTCAELFVQARQGL